MTALLFPLADRVIVTAPDNSRAMPPEEIPAPGATITHTVGTAVASAREAERGRCYLHHRILVRGGRSARAPRTIETSVERCARCFDHGSAHRHSPPSSSDSESGWYRSSIPTATGKLRWRAPGLAPCCSIERGKSQGGRARKNRRRRQLCVRVQSSELHGYAGGCSRTFRCSFRFLAKRGLFQIPFLGWHLARAGHIRVPREMRGRR